MDYLRAESVLSKKQTCAGWGFRPGREAAVIEAQPLTARWPDGPAIARGAGRAYGDAALADTVLATRQLDALIAFDAEAGTLVCEAGVSVADLLEVTLPRGWVLPVIPGTRFVSVGGAIAADIHGKNHHHQGAFSSAVQWFDLLLPNQDVVRVAPGEPLFLATCGGMGLTGLIARVALQLLPAASAEVDWQRLPCDNLQHLRALANEHADDTFSVAWLDLSGQQPMQGGSLGVGELASNGGTEVKWQSSLPLPPLANWCVSDGSMRLVNRFLRWREMRPAQGRVSLETFFFPLDRIHRWNRLYRRGLLQYQFVVPEPTARAAIDALTSRLARSSARPYLSVWKRMGAANDNWLSFPMAGETLAMDFPRRPDVLALFNDFDAIVTEHGGRVYLAKDARLSVDAFRAMYPNWTLLAELRETMGLAGKVSSDLSTRLQL